MDIGLLGAGMGGRGAGIGGRGAGIGGRGAGVGRGARVDGSGNSVVVDVDEVELIGSTCLSVSKITWKLICYSFDIFTIQEEMTFGNSFQKLK